MFLEIAVVVVVVLIALYLLRDKYPNISGTYKLEEPIAKWPTSINIVKESKGVYTLFGGQLKLSLKFDAADQGAVSLLSDEDSVGGLKFQGFNLLDGNIILLARDATDKNVTLKLVKQ